MAQNTKGQKAARDNAKKCDYCGQIFNRKYKPTIDHFYPLHLDRANLNKSWNKFITCKQCNDDKRYMKPERFIIALQRKLKTTPHACGYYSRCTNSIKNIKILIDKLENYFNARDLL